MKFADNGDATLINTAHGTSPAVIHGNGPSKIYLNGYGNYIAGAYVGQTCMPCKEQRIELNVSQAIQLSSPVLVHFSLSICRTTPNCPLSPWP